MFMLKYALSVIGRTERFATYRVLPFLLLLLLLQPAAKSYAQALPTSQPEEEKVSAARLRTLHAALRRSVAEGQYAGLVTLIARNGRIVDWQAVGFRDLARKLPMERDTMSVRLPTSLQTSTGRA